MFEKDPRRFEADVKGLSPEQKAIVKLEITLTNFFKSFDSSVTRWERLVYPSLLVMALLGLSGFYLIYNMTNDMKTLTQNVDPKMKSNLGAMSGHMSELSNNISVMTEQITVLVGKIDSMDAHIVNMDQSVGDINSSVKNMTQNVAAMSHAVGAMTVNTGVMTRDVNEMGRPMQFMNSFAPW